MALRIKNNLCRRVAIGNYLLTLLLLSYPSLGWGLAAFPTAQGMGASSTGGRNAGATIYIVDTLSDDPDDGVTFREACTASGARYVVFAVSGVITLSSELVIDDDYLTIAGQTSPGGICIAGYQVRLYGVHDVIITHMRFRTGPLGAGSGYHAVVVEGGSAVGGADGHAAAGTDPCYDIIFDHCSFSWGLDENIDLAYDVYDVTFSWCAITSPLWNGSTHHDLGLLAWGKYNSTPNGISVHHTFFGYNYYRVPEGNYQHFVDLVNNVQYWFYSSYAPCLQTFSGYSAGYLNVRHCYNDVRGSASELDPTTHAQARSAIIYSTLSAYAMVYMVGCLSGTRTTQEAAEWDVGWYASPNWGRTLASENWKATTAIATHDIAVTATTMSATYAATVVAGAGANRVQSTQSLTYDDIDEWAQSNYTAGTGAYKLTSSIDGIEDWGSYSTPSPPTDSDSDGMSDAWETTQFGSTSAMPNADADGDGYANLEEYLHYLAGYGAEGGGGSILLLEGVNLQGLTLQ